MAMTFKPSTTGVNPRKIGLWRDETKGGGFVLHGSMWRGGPQLRICVNAAGQIWLIQIQQREAAAKTSLNLRCSWSLNDKAELACIEVEDKLLLNVEDLNEVASQAENGPVAEITFAELPPQVQILKLVAERKAAGLSESYAPREDKPVNYEHKETAVEDKKKVAPAVVTGEKPEGGDDIPF